jgi:Undecaprenyl-phosphate glucose phosphotransferase
VLIVYSIIFLVLIAITFASNNSSDFSRIWVFSWFVVSMFLISLARLTVHLVVRRWSKTGRLTRNIAIVGTEKQAARLVELLNKHAEPWIRIVGIFDERATRVPAAVGGYPLLGNLDDLINFVRNKRIDDVLVALPGVAEQRTLDILNKLNVLPVCVRLCPDMIGFNFLNHEFSFYGGLPVLNVFNKPIAGWDTVAKEIEDRVLGFMFFVLLLPVMLVIAILIKLDSPGPIFFRQERDGFNNKVIPVLKFRTMYTDKLDSNAEKLVTKDDPRVTRIGAILRRTSLDELPQIINVLKGEMSIVGPRPHAKRAKAGGRYYYDIVAQYAVRHKVKPGITGWAQVNGWRGETDTEEKIIKRVEYDLDYIKRWSFMFDVRILMKTIIVLFLNKNAY